MHGWSVAYWLGYLGLEAQVGLIVHGPSSTLNTDRDGGAKGGAGDVGG